MTRKHRYFSALLQMVRLRFTGLMDCSGPQGKSREDWNESCHKYFRWTSGHLYGPSNDEAESLQLLELPFLPVTVCPSIQRNQRCMEMQGGEGHLEFLSFEFLAGILSVPGLSLQKGFQALRSWCLWDCPGISSHSSTSLDLKGYFDQLGGYPPPQPGRGSGVHLL